MYIEPNTVIRILKNVPLDKTYDHTIYFDSITDQLDYFIGKTKYTFQRQSYQRVQRGWMRIEQQAEDLYDCNYLMFQNTAFGNKWFYAFIKSVEYVNNKVSQIEFEIDVLQTWHFDYTLDECFVEREHSLTDFLFERLVPENLDLGNDFVCNSTQDFDISEMSVAIISAKPNAQGEFKGETINNVYTPLYVSGGLPVSNTTGLDSIVNSYVEDGQEDRIVTIYQYPTWIGVDLDEVKTEDIQLTPSVDNIDGYTPRNKKLLSYPYNFMLASNNNGQTAEYHYENWSPTYCSFKAVGVAVSTPCVMIYPKNYRGITDDYDSGLTLSSFPQCPWVGDTYKAWMAQNRSSVVTSTISTALSATLAASLFAANPGIGGSAVAFFGATAGVSYNLLSSANHIAQTMAKVKDLKNTPPQVHGQSQTDSLNAGIRRIKFSFYALSIKREIAKTIDDYFDRYGYACHENKIPNRNVRPHWCYTKTIGCTITGSLPSDDTVAICNIYNNGITWWKNGDEVGNYNLDNSPS